MRSASYKRHFECVTDTARVHSETTKTFSIDRISFREAEINTVEAVTERRRVSCPRRSWQLTPVASRATPWETVGLVAPGVGVY
jgi:hypothetical protein